MRYLPLLILLLCANISKAQVKLTEENWTLPTFKVEPAEKAPMFFTKDVFQGASRYIYPYAMNDMISGEKVNHDWKALTLENEYIKLCITPEIGGKIYYATDKTNGYNFVYKNNEVIPANIGMTGAWVSGGIEWCMFHHHRASSFLPMDYSTKEHEDGRKTIYIGEIEPRHSMRWSVAVTMTPGKSYFEAELSAYNPTPYTNTFLYWANVAAHATTEFQTIFPPSVDFATYHSKNEFTRWPVSTETYRREDYSKGVDISWWKNVRSSASFFIHDLKEDFMGAYDHGQHAGTVHVGDHNIVKGAKLWEWGSGPRGQATEGKLTETSGPYVEIMVGAFSDNQPDYSWIRPYEVKRWKQYWYPVKDIEGFKNANIDAAVNLEERKGSKFFLGYYSTQKLERARIILKNKENIILQKEIEISPENAFTELIKIEGDYQLSDLYTQMVNLETGEEVISYQPKEKSRIEKLPVVVDRPPSPEEIETIEELYLTGNRIEQFYKISDIEALDYYKEALRRDPNDIRVNTLMGNRFLKAGDYNSARTYFSKAIKRLTRDYTRPSSCEAIYLQGITLKALGLYDEAIDTLYRASWDYAFHSAAYFELAQISCLKRDFNRALDQVNESLSTNMKNHRAIALKVSIQRHLGKHDDALITLGDLDEKDPLNFRMANEKYLLLKEEGDAGETKKQLLSMTKRMRDHHENYLELAVGYIKEGMVDEADDVLGRYKGDYPMIEYYKGFAKDAKGDAKMAKQAFDLGNKMGEDYCFPYRLFTVNVLNKALEYNANDGKALYYLGNIYYDALPAKAISYWKKAVEKQSDLAIAYRNLGWGYYRHFEDYKKAIPFYEKAIALDKSQAIYFNELDVLYEKNNESIETRLALFDGNQKAVRKRDDAFIRQMTVLTLGGQSDKAVQSLQGKTFSYREGTSRVREKIIDAHLVLGLDYLEKRQNEKALEQFLLAQVPDEEAGSARSGNRMIQVNYFIGKAYEELGKDRKAKMYFQLAAKAETSRGRGYMSYYKGLSLLNLNEKTAAKEVFESLVEKGDKLIHGEDSEDADFFTIFGEREDLNILKSQAFTIRGLGYKGLEKSGLAKSDLHEALKLSVGNLWAGIEVERSAD